MGASMVPRTWAWSTGSGGMAARAITSSRGMTLPSMKPPLISKRPSIFLAKSLTTRAGATGSSWQMARDVVPLSRLSSSFMPQLSTAKRSRVFFTTAYSTLFLRSSERSWVSSATVMPL